MSLITIRHKAANAGGDIHKLIMAPESARQLTDFSRLPLLLPAHLSILNIAAALCGGTSSGGMRLVAYSPSDVAATGPDMNKRIHVSWGQAGVDYMVVRRSSIPDYGVDGHAYLRTTDDTDPTQDGRVLFGPEDQYVLWPLNDGRTRVTDSLLREYPSFVVPIPEDVHPTSIIGTHGTLLEGIDFFVGIGVVVFRQHPDTILPESGKMVLRSSRSGNLNAMSYIWGTDATTADTALAEVLRGSGSVRALERACRAEAGMYTLPRESTLLDAIPFRSGTAYRFDSTIVWIGYRHEPLVPGNLYPAGWCIGGEKLRLFSSNGSSAWHRDPHIDWSRGMPLDGIVAVAGLTAPDYSTTATYDSSTGDLDHARIWLEGTPEAREAYWAHCKSSEIKTGLTIASLIGVNSGSPSAVVNVIDLFFAYGILDRIGIVADLRLNDMPAGIGERVVNLLRREKPAGSILITLNS